MRTRNPLRTCWPTGSRLWFSLLGAIVISLICYASTAAIIAADSRMRFAGYTRLANAAIESRIKSYADLLRSSAAMFNMHYPISRSHFHTYVRGLHMERNFPAVENLNFATCVPLLERKALEQRMRAEFIGSGLYRQFEITPPGQRDLVCPMTHAEPVERGTASLGVDQWANPLLRPQLEATRDTGALTSSTRTLANVSGPNRTGLELGLPVYREGYPLDTVEQRRAAFLGSLGVAFRLQDIVKGVIDEMPLKGVRMRLVDRQLGKELYDTYPERPPMERARPFFKSVVQHSSVIDFNGSTWDAQYEVEVTESNSGFEAFIPWLGLFCGFIGTLLLTALFQARTMSRRRAVTMAKEMTRELRRSKAKLKEYNLKLRNLSAHAERIKECERKRIAREIHDDLGQNMLALRIEADMLAARTAGRHPILHGRAVATLRQIDSTIHSVRGIINDLRPTVLDLGLFAAVEWQCNEFQRRTGIACVLHRSNVRSTGVSRGPDSDDEPRLEEAVKTAAFRILQESLCNVQRHARASAVKVELIIAPARLTLTVEDNGIGIQGKDGNVHHQHNSFGLVGIEERAGILGGTFSLSSPNTNGTTVCVSVPLTPPVCIDEEEAQLA